MAHQKWRDLKIAKLGLERVEQLEKEARAMVAGMNHKDAAAYMSGWSLAASGQHENADREPAFERGRADGRAALEQVTEKNDAYVEGWKQAAFGARDGDRAGRPGRHGEPDYVRGAAAGDDARKQAEGVALSYYHE